MFGVFESLARATVGAVVRTPVALVADVVTLGGVLTDKKEPYTSSAVSDVVKNIERAAGSRD